MKTIKNLILLFIAIFMASCSGGGSKFEGKWTPVNTRFGHDIITIERDGDFYKLLSEDGMNAGSLRYDKKKGALTGEMSGQSFDITYNKDTENITITPQGYGVSIVLRKEEN